MLGDPRQSHLERRGQLVHGGVTARRRATIARLVGSARAVKVASSLSSVSDGMTLVCQLVS